jgi:hypothetical protein
MKNNSLNINNADFGCQAQLDETSSDASHQQA